MPQEWVGVRELGRRVGRKHRAVQRAVEEGRIPAAAVRRNPSSGRVVAIEYHAAALAWDGTTDPAKAIRSAEPLRLPPPGPVQTSGHCSISESGLARLVKAGLLDLYEAEAMRFSPAYDLAFVSLPAALAKEGLIDAAIDRVLEQLYQAMALELRARNEPDDFIAGEVSLLRDRVKEEREDPGSWTT